MILARCLACKSLTALDATGCCEVHGSRKSCEFSALTSSFNGAASIDCFASGLAHRLTTFNGTVGEVSLVPNHDGDGTFTCVVTKAAGEDYLVWSRAEMERFPEAKELKQRVRDVIAPENKLGHSEAKESDASEEQTGGTGRTAVQRLLSLLRRDKKG